MVYSKLPLLALAGSALAGVVQRDDSDFEHLNHEKYNFGHPPAWATLTPKEFSRHPKEPHSTYIPPVPFVHLPTSTGEPAPFITRFPGQGEFAHTRDSVGLASTHKQSAHPFSGNGEFPHTRDSVRPASSPKQYDHPFPPHLLPSHLSGEALPSNAAEASNPPPAFSKGTAPSHLLSADPESWGNIGPVAPSGHPESSSWGYSVPPPFASGVGELAGSGKPPGIAQPPPPRPSQPRPSEWPKPHGSSPPEVYHLPPPLPSQFDAAPLPAENIRPTGPAVSLGGPSPHTSIIPAVSCPYSGQPIPDEESSSIHYAGGDKGGAPWQGAPGFEKPKGPHPMIYQPHPSQSRPDYEASAPYTLQPSIATSAEPMPSIPAKQPHPSKASEPHYVYGPPPRHGRESSAKVEKVASTSTVRPASQPSQINSTGDKASNTQFSSFGPASFTQSVAAGVLVGAVGIVILSVSL